MGLTMVLCFSLVVEALQFNVQQLAKVSQSRSCPRRDGPFGVTRRTARTIRGAFFETAAPPPTAVDDGAAARGDAAKRAVDVATRASEALRDGYRDNRMKASSRVVLAMVSPKNNAAALTAAQFAASVLRHEAHYAPLLRFDALKTASVLVARDGSTATVRADLLDARGARTGVAVWSLSATAGAAPANWLIDAVLVQDDRAEASVADEPADTGRREGDAADGESCALVDDDDDDDDAQLWASMKSPLWVAKTVLNALRRVDEPHANAGADVAIRYCSSGNPTSRLPPEIFRGYLDDDAYPYAVLTRWIDMRPDGDIIFDNVSLLKT